MSAAIRLPLPCFVAGPVERLRRAIARSLLAAATLAMFAPEAGAAELRSVQTNTTVLAANTLSVLAAQQQYVDSGAFPELLSIYHLLGDPAPRVR